MNHLFVYVPDPAEEAKIPQSIEQPELRHEWLEHQLKDSVNLNWSHNCNSQDYFVAPTTDMETMINRFKDQVLPFVLDYWQWRLTADPWSQMLGISVQPQMPAEMLWNRHMRTFLEDAFRQQTAIRMIDGTEWLMSGKETTLNPTDMITFIHGKEGFELLNKVPQKLLDQAFDWTLKTIASGKQNPDFGLPSVVTGGRNPINGSPYFFTAGGQDTTGKFVMCSYHALKQLNRDHLYQMALTDHITFGSNATVPKNIFPLLYNTIYGFHVDLLDKPEERVSSTWRRIKLMSASKLGSRQNS